MKTKYSWKKYEDYYTLINFIKKEKKVNVSILKTINLENQEKIRKHLKNICGINILKEDLEYIYSSSDNSNISDSNFLYSEYKDLNLKSIAKSLNY